MDDDDLVESDVAYCDECEEEYWLPEDAEQCPACGSHNITFSF